jgi:NADH dehydrogenase (ubiquinone) 1 alpha subcomplex subunit 2
MASKAVKLSPSLKELRLHLCQKSAASAGTREFVEKFYVPLKTANPKFPILVRECSGIQPRVWARFGYGREESAELTNKSSKEVMDIIAKFQ